MFKLKPLAFFRLYQLFIFFMNNQSSSKAYFREPQTIPYKQWANNLENFKEETSLFTQEQISNERQMEIPKTDTDQFIQELLDITAYIQAQDLKFQPITTLKTKFPDITRNDNEGMSENLSQLMNESINNQISHNNYCLSNDHKQHRTQPKQLNKSFSGSAEQKTKTVKKGDDRKNMCKNSLTKAIKAYISQHYLKRVDKIHKRLKIDDIESSKSYYSREINRLFQLKDNYRLLNYQEGSQKQKGYKRAFLIFYRYFMREKYPVHVIQGEKIKCQLAYLKDTNLLVYLPSIKEKKGKKEKNTTKSTQMSPDQYSASLLEINQALSYRYY